MGMTADPREFAGKRVLVSGGTKGLGRATVERFLAGGARVITAARTIRNQIEGVDYVEADLTTAAGGEALSKAAIEQLGGVDILAHVVGGSSSPGGGFAALTDEHWLAELNLNLLATVRLDRLWIHIRSATGRRPQRGFGSRGIFWVYDCVCGGWRRAFAVTSRVVWFYGAGRA